MAVLYSLYYKNTKWRLLTSSYILHNITYQYLHTTVFTTMKFPAMKVILIIMEVRSCEKMILEVLSHIRVCLSKAEKKTVDRLLLNPNFLQKTKVCVFSFFFLMFSQTQIFILGLLLLPKACSC